MSGALLDHYLTRSSRRLRSRYVSPLCTDERVRRLPVTARLASGEAEGPGRQPEDTAWPPSHEIHLPGQPQFWHHCWGSPLHSLLQRAVSQHELTGSHRNHVPECTRIPNRGPMAYLSRDDNCPELITGGTCAHCAVESSLACTCIA